VTHLIGCSSVCQHSSKKVAAFAKTVVSEQVGALAKTAVRR
jgi:hypothetical protein